MPAHGDNTDTLPVEVLALEPPAAPEPPADVHDSTLSPNTLRAKYAGSSKPGLAVRVLEGTGHKEHAEQGGASDTAPTKTDAEIPAACPSGPSEPAADNRKAALRASVMSLITVWSLERISHADARFIFPFFT